MANLNGGTLANNGHRKQRNDLRKQMPQDFEAQPQIRRLSLGAASVSTTSCMQSFSRRTCPIALAPHPQQQTQKHQQQHGHSHSPQQLQQNEQQQTKMQHQQQRDQNQQPKQSQRHAQQQLQLQKQLQLQQQQQLQKRQQQQQLQASRQSALTRDLRQPHSQPQSSQANHTADDLANALKRRVDLDPAQPFTVSRAPTASLLSQQLRGISATGGPTTPATGSAITSSTDGAISGCTPDFNRQVYLEPSSCTMLLKSRLGNLIRHPHLRWVISQTLILNPCKR